MHIYVHIHIYIYTDVDRHRQTQTDIYRQRQAPMLVRVHPRHGGRTCRPASMNSVFSIPLALSL